MVAVDALHPVDKTVHTVVGQSSVAIGGFEENM